MAAPGIAATHHWSRMKRRPEAIIAPHSGEWRLRSETQKAETGGGQDDTGHIECHAHDERGETERDDVFQHDTPGRCPHQLDRGDEVGVSKRHGFGACNTGIRRPGGDGDRQHRIFNARTKCCNERKRKNELGKGKKDIGDTHQHRVDPSTGITGDGADDETDRGGDDRHQHDDEKRQTRAVDQAGQNISPLIVGAEPISVCPRRQQAGIAKIALNRGMWRQDIGEDCDKHQRQDDAEPC